MPLHKKPHKMNLSFSKYAGVIANVSLIREVAVYIYKELVATSFWNEYKQLQSPSKWISHVLLRKCFVMGLKLEVRKVQVSDVSDTIQFARKKKSSKFMMIL